MRILCLRFLPCNSSECLEPDSDYRNEKGRCNKKRPPLTEATKASEGKRMGRAVHHKHTLPLKTLP
jgi:hypothetical protein